MSESSSNCVWLFIIYLISIIPLGVRFDLFNNNISYKLNYKFITIIDLFKVVINTIMPSNLLKIKVLYQYTSYKEKF
jgi:hypothetical protein